MVEEIKADTAAWILVSMRNPNLVPSGLNPPARTAPEPRDHLPLVPRLRGLIGQCSRPYEKQLTDADTKSSQSRIFIGKKFVETSILPMLNEHEHLDLNGIEVNVYNLRGKQYKMKFKFWSSKYYVLMEGWTAFCRDNDLVCGNVVKLWMFRHLETHQLCFVISSVKMNE